mmetsp:Transcript_31215/g.47218  ORF Transcript_31215/g.47218 Transcript_31215/m.47218 type:complete len:153 (-) Transcript_31215:137-595(-)
MYSFLHSSRRCLALFQSFPLPSRFYVPAASSLQSPAKHHSQQFRSCSTKKDTREIVFKKDLAKHLVEKHGSTVHKYEMMITDIFDLIAKKVAEDKVVRISMFGKFSKAVSGRKVGRHFRTGEYMEIPEFVRPKFNAFKAFKQSLKDAEKEEV